MKTTTKIVWDEISQRREAHLTLHMGDESEFLALVPGIGGALRLICQSGQMQVGRNVWADGIEVKRGSTYSVIPAGGVVHFVTIAS